MKTITLEFEDNSDKATLKFTGCKPNDLLRGTYILIEALAEASGFDMVTTAKRLLRDIQNKEGK